MKALYIKRGEDMKKTSYIISIIILTSTISACSNPNRTIGENGVNPNTTNNINQGTNNTGYRDGTFTGESNKTTNGRQIANVTVSGGKISNISLKTVDNNGKDVGTTLSSNNMNGRNGSTTGNGIGTNGSTGGTGATGGNGTNGGTGTMGTTPSSYMNSISNVGYKLVNQVVQNQSPNTNVQHNLVGKDVTVLNNYKEAIQRALAKARR